ncbi:MAG: hypothetical protein JNJ58_09690 [Chitinophagaceae bacterium]|nr:hypothetical protein [Chitinophagaceae bacterium]
MDNLLDSAKGKLNELTGAISNRLQIDVLGHMKDYGVDKLNEVWVQIDEATDVIHRTGYSVTNINIKLGLPPTVDISFNQIENIGDGDEEKLLEEYQGKTFIYSILVALFKANAMQKSINSARYKFTGITMGMGITPSLEMHFSKV